MQNKLSILRLASLPENSLSKVFLRSAILAGSLEIASRRPVADTVVPNQLAELCSVFCCLLATEVLFEADLSPTDMYIIATLCHQVSVHDQGAEAVAQFIGCTETL